MTVILPQPPTANDTVAHHVSGGGGGSCASQGPKSSNGTGTCSEEGSDSDSGEEGGPAKRPRTRLSVAQAGTKRRGAGGGCGRGRLGHKALAASGSADATAAVGSSGRGKRKRTRLDEDAQRPCGAGDSRAGQGGPGAQGSGTGTAHGMTRAHKGHDEAPPAHEQHQQPLLPQLHTLRATRCALPPLALLLPAAGCRALQELALCSCHVEVPHAPYAPEATPTATAAAGPTGRARRRGGGAAASAAAVASGSTTTTSATVRARAEQLLRAAELEALVTAVAGSLRVLHVAAPTGLLQCGGAADVRALAAAVPRLRRLRSLCWEVPAEQQDRLLGAVAEGGLGELATLVVSSYVG